MENLESSNKKKFTDHGALFFFIWSVISVCVLTACILAFEALFSWGMYDSTKLFRKNCEEWLLHDYACYALSDFRNDYHMNELKNTNFQFAVLYTEDKANADFTDPSSYEICNLPEEYIKGNVYDLFAYSATLGDYSCFVYDVDSLWNSYSYVNNFYNYGSPVDVGIQHYISSIVYVWNTDSTYILCEDGTYYPVTIEVTENRYDDVWDLKSLLNQERTHWLEEYCSEVELQMFSEHGTSSYISLNDINIVKSDYLRDHTTIDEEASWGVDFNNWSVWTEDITADNVEHADYFLFAKVAEPLNMDCDDLFARSKPLIDLACTLRFLPIIFGFIAGIIWFVTSLIFIVKFFKFLGKGFKRLSYQWHNNVGLLFRLIGICVLATGAEFIVLVGALSGGAEEIVLLGWIFQTLILAPLFIISVLQLNRLAKGAKSMAEGNLSTPVDTNHMFFDFKTIGDSMNSVSAGMEIAVSERMKSERFKTELISNVSHDIKTPLTSIISYVELLKEQPAGEPANPEYLETLERQSVKLKKLLEDLIEASKAQTGNLKAELTPCNVNMVLHQVIGEYKERLDAAQLDLNIRLPEEDVNIMADTKHLQRVLDNLLVNVSKYAQPGTRVYVNLTGGSDDVAIEIKNTSKEPLNITSDELLERFVRGDSSRNSEGNGLGLSIAQSLMELMNGKLKLVVDGDLFKVILLFPRVKE